MFRSKFSRTYAETLLVDGIKQRIEKKEQVVYDAFVVLCESLYAVLAVLVDNIRVEMKSIEMVSTINMPF
jgi:hypothetical protein